MSLSQFRARAMFSVIFEVHPKQEKFDLYLDLAKGLKPILEEAVRSELVSEDGNSLLAGKIQGNYSIRPLTSNFRIESARAIRCLQTNSLRCGTGN
jgi:hypothetical protein